MYRSYSVHHPANRVSTLSASNNIVTSMLKKHREIFTVAARHEYVNYSEKANKLQFTASLYLVGI